jgi:hypothetical protein
MGAVADFFVRAKGWLNPAFSGEGVERDPWYQRDGSLVLTPWEEAYARAGRMFVGNLGSATSPATFGAGSIDTTEPDWDLALPSGSPIAVLPLWLDIEMEAFGTTAIFEGMMCTGMGGVQGTMTSVTPKNVRTDAPYASVCVVGGAADAGATFMTSNVAEYFRFGIQAAATIATGNDTSSRTGETYRWRRGIGGFPVLIANGGIARWNAFAAAQASTGFISAGWLEVPKELVC